MAIAKWRVRMVSRRAASGWPPREEREKEISFVVL